MSDYADSAELASWQTNRFIHRVAAWLGGVLFVAAGVEWAFLFEAGEQLCAAWALIAWLAAIWFTYRMIVWFRFAETRIDHIHRRRELYAHLDNAFELVMERRGAKVIRHKGAA